jgi:hypothetical protein
MKHDNLLEAEPMHVGVMIWSRLCVIDAMYTLLAHSSMLLQPTFTFRLTLMVKTICPFNAVSLTMFLLLLQQMLDRRRSLCRSLTSNSLSRTSPTI